MKTKILPKLAYLLAWILLFTPPFLIRTTGREFGYTLLAALFFFPLALYRKTLAFCIPLLILVGAANIFHAQFLGNMIDEFSVATMLRTEIHEAREFFDVVTGRMVWAALLWLFVSAASSYYLWRNCRFQSERFPLWNKRVLVSGALLWVSFFAFGVTQQFGVNDYVHKLRHIYPMHMAKAAVRYQELTQEVFYQPVLPAKPDAALAKTLVLVIGESSSSHRWSLLGYKDEDTNQSLKSISGLRSRAVMANGFNTAKALPFILTGQSSLDSQKNASPSFLDLAQHAGYKVFVFSNSRFNDKSEDMYSQIFRRSADVYAKVGNGEHDEVMTARLAQSLADQAEYKLIVLHTYGSHPDISKRYPHSRYQGGDAYNNSIRYTSDLLAQWIRMVDSASNASSALLYVADHGLGVPPCVETVRHGNGQSSLEVPLVYWANAALAQHQPKEVFEFSESIIERSTTLAPELLVGLQGYSVAAAMPHLQSSRILELDGKPYSELYRKDACTP